MGSIISSIRRGITAVESAYRGEVQKAEQRAKVRMRAAKSQYQKQTVQAGLELERLQLQRQMYEAKARVKAEKAAVVKARQAAGVYTYSEQIGKALGPLGRDLAAAGKKLFTSDRPARRTPSHRR